MVNKEIKRGKKSLNDYDRESEFEEKEKEREKKVNKIDYVTDRVLLSKKHWGIQVNREEEKKDYSHSEGLQQNGNRDCDCDCDRSWKLEPGGWRLEPGEAEESWREIGFVWRTPDGRAQSA